MKILVIHGPNLNLLGRREPSQYGTVALEEINKKITSYAKREKVEVTIFQSNSEGDIINKIHEAVDFYDGILINPGAYTHTSIAIRDALSAIELPVVEVHLSNIYKREGFRKKSFISEIAIGVISGFKEYSYILGTQALIHFLKERFHSQNIDK